MDDAAIPKKLETTSIGLSEAETADVQLLLCELAAPCTEVRARALVSQLSAKLQGYMGIEDEMLCFTFWSDYQRKQGRH